MRCCIEAPVPLTKARIWVRRLWVVPALVLTTLAAGCHQPPPPTLDLPVYFTCDTRGRLEPCGCFVGQFGGLTRLKTVLDAEASTNALRVDVGDAIDGNEDYEFMEYRYMLRAPAGRDPRRPTRREVAAMTPTVRDVLQASVVAMTRPIPPEAGPDYAASRIGIISMLTMLAAQEAEQCAGAAIKENADIRAVFADAAGGLRRGACRPALGRGAGGR